MALPYPDGQVARVCDVCFVRGRKSNPELTQLYQTVTLPSNVRAGMSTHAHTHKHTHKHTHINAYIYFVNNNRFLTLFTILKEIDISKFFIIM